MARDLNKHTIDIIIVYEHTVMYSTEKNSTMRFCLLLFFASCTLAASIATIGFSRPEQLLVTILENSTEQDRLLCVRLFSSADELGRQFSVDVVYQHKTTDGNIL